MQKSSSVPTKISPSPARGTPTPPPPQQQDPQTLLQKSALMDAVDEDNRTSFVFCPILTVSFFLQLITERPLPRDSKSI